MSDVDIVDSVQELYDAQEKALEDYMEDYAENDEKVLQEIFNLMFDDEGEVDPVFRDSPSEWYDDDEDDEGDEDEEV